MKRLLCMVIVLLVTQAVVAQSLGDLARKQRSVPRKHATRTYTNDEISGPAVEPGVTTPAAATADPEAAEATPSAEDKAKPAEAKEQAAAVDPKKADEDKKKAAEQWKTAVLLLKREVSNLEREINITQGEQKLRATAFYSDPGLRIRDDKKWAEEDRKYKADLEAKQQALTATRQKLVEVQEQARKAGMPSAVYE